MSFLLQRYIVKGVEISQRWYRADLIKDISLEFDGSKMIVSVKNHIYVYVSSLADLEGRARRTPPYGTKFFRFRTHFCRKAPTLEVHAPPPPPTGNPGSATGHLIPSVTDVHNLIFPFYYRTLHLPISPLMHIYGKCLISNKM